MATPQLTSSDLATTYAQVPDAATGRNEGGSS